MKTQTASRRANAETATLPIARQTQTDASRKARVVQAARPLAGETTNPLRALFSAEEIALIDERCRLMGRSVVEIVTTALRQWVKPAAPSEDEDEHLSNGDESPALAEQDRFAGLAILGKEVARVTNETGELEMVYCSGTHYHYVFEVTEFFADGKWCNQGDWHDSNGFGNFAAFRAFLAQLPLSHVRRSFIYEKGFDVDMIVEWFDQNTIPYTDHLRAALEAFNRRETTVLEDIAKEVLAGERARIARVMNTALAA